jgi:hypothetical protein
MSVMVKHSTLSFPKLKGVLMNDFMSEHELKWLTLAREFLGLDERVIAYRLGVDEDFIKGMEAGFINTPDVMQYKFLLERELQKTGYTVKIVPYPTTKKFWDGDTTK